MLAARAPLSSLSSRSISCGATKSASLSLTRWSWAIVPDRAQRRAADLAHALGKLVGSGENLLGLLVEQQVVVAEMRSAHVPMEVLRLHVEREHVGQNGVDGSGNGPDRLAAEVGGRGERGGRRLTGFKVSHARHGMPHRLLVGRARPLRPGGNNGRADTLF